MAATATPYGLYVRKMQGARRNTAGNLHYPVLSGVTGAIYYGAPVAFVAGGGVGPMAASPISTVQTCGVMQGAQWISPTKPEWFPSLPAGAAASGKNVEAMVNDDPSAIMMIQASGAIANPLTKIGSVAAFVVATIASGNNATGRSIAALDVASIAASGDKAFRIVGYVLDPLDPFPDVLVQWNNGVHAMQAMTSVEGVAPDAVDPETQNAAFEEFVIARQNMIREEQGLPPLPTFEERQKAEEDRLEDLRKRQEEFQKRVEQRVAERRKASKSTSGPTTHANHKTEPVLAKKGDK